MITYIIIGVTIIVSIMAFPPQIAAPDFLRKPGLINRLEFNPYLVYHRKQYYRLFTSALVHSGWFHLLINMFVLYSFGRLVEAYFVSYFGFAGGELLYLFFYVSAVAVASLADLNKFKDSPYYNAVGASGAVSAVVYAAILFQPLSKLYIFPIPIPIPAILFGVIYLLYESQMAKRQVDNIGHSAHFYGSLYGLLFPILLRPAFFMEFLSKLHLL